MADLTITPASVALSSDTSYAVVQVGEAVTQGQPGYLNSSDTKYYRADANDTSAKAVASGIFMSPAATDGYALFAVGGHVNLGATLTVGQVYVVSTNVGGIAPYSDLGTGHYVTILGIGITSALLKINPNVSGIQKP